METGQPIRQFPAGAPSTFAINTTGGTVFSLAKTERASIQNLSTATLCVKLGTGASATSLNWILKACAVAADGTSTPLIIEGYVGDVSVYSASAYSFLAWKH
jgi:hypothetical protein